jgi:nitroreductase
LQNPRRNSRKDHPINILEAIQGRHSTRAFLTKPVPKEIVYKILDCARFSPSGGNVQPWQVVVVTGDYQKQIGDRIIQAKESGIKENPDYQYYPINWAEPFKSRRKTCGLALYSALHITMEEKEKRKIAWYRNYRFFGAPVGLIFLINNTVLEKGSWVDIGMFIQNVMLAAREFGLATCPQASIAEYPDIVREVIGASQDNAVVCGMSLGYEDTEAAVNQYRTEREKVEAFTQFLGF